MSSVAGSFTKGKGWRRSIGKRRGEDGKVRDARFWLGMDERQASVAALRLEALWLSLGRSVWTSEGLEEAERIRGGSGQAAAVERIVAARTVVPSAVVKRDGRDDRCARSIGMTLADGLRRYADHVRADEGLADATRRGMLIQLSALERSPHADDPLASLTYERLESIVRHWFGRPKRLDRKGRISARWARNLVATLRQSLDWLDAAGHWVAPRRWERALSLRRGQPCKPHVQTFGVGDLATLYRLADERMKLCMLLALNCGYANMELATLRREEVDLEAGTIRRERTKTGVQGSWTLWAETKRALEAWFSTHPHDDLAIRSPNGSPLVWHHGGKRREYIRDGWRTTQDRCEASGTAVTRLPFKYLRKTGATMIRSIGGIEVSEQYLSHAETSMARWYSVPDEGRLAEALAELRLRLAPMFGG